MNRTLQLLKLITQKQQKFKLAVKTILSSYFTHNQFNYGIDIGCGDGTMYDLISPYCTSLDGVDVKINNHNQYNITYSSDIKQFYKSYKINKYDVIFMFDVIEHFDYDEGMAILHDLINLNKTIILTTPSKFNKNLIPYFATGNKYFIHKSLFDIKTLKNIGFETELFSQGFIPDLLYGKEIIAIHNTYL